MTQDNTRTLPEYDSAERPAWLVHGAKEALSVALPPDEDIGWSEFVVRACDEMMRRSDGLAGSAGADDGGCGGAANTANASVPGLEIAMTAELLGGIAQRATSPYDVDELCRRAYPRRWVAALDEVAADPNVGVDPDPVLYDHSVSLHAVCGADAPWPDGMHEALQAVLEFAQCVSSASSIGLSLAQVVPSPVVWPPPEASGSLSNARCKLDDALAGTPIGHEEHATMLRSYLSARDNPDAPDPSLAETDQVEASVRDWYASVVPAAICLAAATFAHAFEWSSSDADRWDPAVTAYAHAEAYLSIHHLRQVTDAYDLTDCAMSGYAWWWCHDRRLDLAGLRELAATW